MCSINLLLTLTLTEVKHCLRIAATFLYYKFRIYILYKCSYFCRCFSDSVGYSLGNFLWLWYGMAFTYFQLHVWLPLIVCALKGKQLEQSAPKWVKIDHADKHRKLMKARAKSGSEASKSPCEATLVVQLTNVIVLDMLVFVRKRGHTFILAHCTDNLWCVVIKIYLLTYALIQVSLFRLNLL